MHIKSCTYKCTVPGCTRAPTNRTAEIQEHIRSHEKQALRLANALNQ